MTKPATPPGPPTSSGTGGAKTPRAERLAAALRANLRRRKVQKQERDRATEAGGEPGRGADTGSRKGS